MLFSQGYLFSIKCWYQWGPWKKQNIYLCGFHTRCLYWVSRQPSPGSNYSASPPMKLMTSQSLPPSSASGVRIIIHSIDLAGLARRKNSHTLHCILPWNSNQSDITQNNSATHPRIGLGLGSLLTPSQTPGPLVFFWLPTTLACTMPLFKWKLSY